MRRTTVMVEESTYADLVEYARRDGVATAHLIREAMERYVTDREAHEAETPRALPSFVGVLDDPDMVHAVDVEEYLAAHWPADIEADRDPEWRVRPHREDA